MTFRYLRKDAIETIRISFDMFRICGLFVYAVCALSVGTVAAMWHYTGFDAAYLMILAYVLLSSVLTCVLMRLYTNLQRFAEENDTK